MEYVAPDAPGLNGLAGLPRRDPPDLAQALRWAIQFCHGMEYAYSRGIRCHRDIKPANILIGADGAVRISDFGIAGMVAPGAAGAARRARSKGMRARGPARCSARRPTCRRSSSRTRRAATSAATSTASASCSTRWRRAARCPSCPGRPRPRRRPALLGRDAQAARGRRSRRRSTRRSGRRSRAACGRTRGDRYPGFAALRADLESLLRERTGETVTVPAAETAEAEELCQQGHQLGEPGPARGGARLLRPGARARPERGGPAQQPGQRALAPGPARRGARRPSPAPSSCGPGYDSALANRALAARAGRCAEALPDCDRALAMNARSAETWQGRAVDLAGLGRRKEAIDAYDAALAIDDRDPHRLGQQGGPAARAGRYAEAPPLLRPRARHRSPRARALGRQRPRLSRRWGVTRRRCPATTRACASSRRTRRRGTTRAIRSCSFSATRRRSTASARPTASPRGPRAPGTTGRRRAGARAAEGSGESLRRYLALDPPPDRLFGQAQWLLKGIDTGELTQLQRGERPPKRAASRGRGADGRDRSRRRRRRGRGGADRRGTGDALAACARARPPRPSPPRRRPAARRTRDPAAPPAARARALVPSVSTTRRTTTSRRAGSPRRLAVYGGHCELEPLNATALGQPRERPVQARASRARRCARRAGPRRARPYPCRAGSARRPSSS